MKLPIAKNKDIVVQNLNDEVLIYNTSTNKAFCLNETSAKVFNHCDGVTSFANLRRKYNFTDDLIYLALDELKAKNLLETDFVSPFAGINRREVIKKVGLATMTALPIITGLTAPKAADAASGSANIAACQPCNPANNQCASGRCAPNAAGGGNICNAGTDSNAALPAGASFGPTDLATCTNSGNQFCCAGNGASFNPINSNCTCNA